MENLLFTDDFIAKKSDLRQFGAILRTNSDVDTHEPNPGASADDPINCHEDIEENVFLQFLRDGIPPQGVLFVQWNSNAHLELIPASAVVLRARTLRVGDSVKRRVSDHMSGTVVNTCTTCTLQPMYDVLYRGTHTIKGILPPNPWETDSGEFALVQDQRTQEISGIPAAELMYVESPAPDDLILYRRWLGRILAVVNKIWVRLGDNCVVELDEEGDYLVAHHGHYLVGDIINTKKGTLRRGNWILGAYNPNTPPVGTVVSVRTTSIDVDWLFGVRDPGELRNPEAPDETLEREELESPDFRVYDRTRRPARGTGVTHGDSADTVLNTEISMGLNYRVRFRDHKAALLKYVNSGLGDIPDLDRTNNAGFDLNVFDITMFGATATIQWQDLTITQESLNELVPNSDMIDDHEAWPSDLVMTPRVSGEDKADRAAIVQSVDTAQRMAKVRWLPDARIYYENLDVVDPERLDFSIGVASDSVHDISLYELETPEQLMIDRGDIVCMNLNILPHDHPSQQKFASFGEIVDLLLDGRLVVRLGAAEVVRDVVVTREKVSIVVRSADDLDSLLSGDEDEDMNDIWSVGASEDGVTYEDENGNPIDPEDALDDDWLSEGMDVEESDDFVYGERPSLISTPQTVPYSEPRPLSDQSDPRQEAFESLEEPPPPYLVLDGAVPKDHRFESYESPSNSAHMKRTQKEHKILSTPSALPDGVFVRTWESRMDLIRVLIIGPSETPYALTPIVLDFRLPSGFPTEPPEAFFHSWLTEKAFGAVGRLNPNLYEDGKVCLSLLGTWEGHEDECWSPTQSTLLQVIVSLLGLVLVREPYYNEAGFEPLMGSDSAKRPSARYSERVGLRARGFLIAALTALHPRSPPHVRCPGLLGVQDAIRWTYWDAKGPKLLDAAIRNVEDILERSEGVEETDGLTIMSKGACIPLRRILERLMQTRL